MNDRLPSRDIVLIGAGHTNMHVVRMWRMQPVPDASLTLISPFSRATYSGMLPGTLAGLYTSEDMEVDLYRFAAPSGVRVIIDEAIGLDAARRRVLFRERAPIRFDVASIGVGSVPAMGDRWPDCRSLLSVKPMATFRTRLDQRLTEMATHRTSADPIRVVVVGAGAAGVEVTLCLEADLRSRNISASFAIVDSGDTVLKGYLPGTIRKVTHEITRRGIELRLNSRVGDVDDSGLMLESGDRVAADIVIWVTGASPSSLIEAIALPKAEDGFLAVRPTLQTTGDAPVFAVGDSASLVETPVRKAGVYAVREGPVLWDNLQRFLNNQSLQTYDPQAGFNSMLADGEGGAFVDYRQVSAHGKWVWRLKDHIDRKFMRMYQDYRPMSTMPAPKSDHDASQSVMRCRGCGGKAGGNILSAAFERLAAEHASFGHPAFDGPEDAARIDTSQHVAELVTVDFFQAFFEDPWLVGRVAALNSLSDIQASGGKPFGALAQIQLPEAHPRQQTEMLYQVLSGSLFELERAGVKLLGGHTTESSDLTVGFTVLGSLGTSSFRKNGLHQGDELFLTKPLGTGVLLAAIPRALTRAEWVDAMLKSMLISNGDIATCAIDAGATAMTDVTGFGLAGHLIEMLDASGVSAEIHIDALPVLDGACELLEQGIESTLAPANRHVQTRMSMAESLLHNPRVAAMFDPQTSGGLLIAAPAGATPVDALENAGHSVFRIGTILEVDTAPLIRIVGSTT